MAATSTIIGTFFGFSGATATAVGGATLAAGAGVAAGAVGSKIAGGGQKAPEPPAALPQPPSADLATSKAEDVVRRKKASLTETTFTSPLGIGGEAQLARKTLLGQ